MYEAIGAPKACDVWAFMNFGLTVIFFIFNCGIFVFSEHREYASKLYNLKQQAVENNDKPKDDSVKRARAHTMNKFETAGRPKIGGLAFMEKQAVSGLQRQVTQIKEAHKLKRKNSYHYQPIEET